MSDKSGNGMDVLLYRDWLTAILIGGSLVFIQEDFRFGFHYVLYFVTLTLTIAHYFRVNTNKRSTWLDFFIPPILATTFFWDNFAPLSISTFALLKVLFYLLIIFQLSSYTLSRSRLWNGKGGIAFAILSALIVIFISMSFSGDLPGDLESRPVVAAILEPPVLNIILAGIMVILSISMWIEPEWFRKSQQVLFILLPTLAFLVALLNVLPRFPQTTAINVIKFPASILCLFIYIYSLSLYKNEFKLSKIVDLVLALTFFLVYVSENYEAINSAISELLKYQGTIGFLGNLIAGILGVVSAIYTFVEFYRRRELN